MATTISTQDIVNAKRDIDDIGKAVNEKVIVSPRYGADFKSLPMIAADAQTKIGEWESVRCQAFFSQIALQSNHKKFHLSVHR